MKYKNIILDIGGVLLSYRWLDLIKETIPCEEEAIAFAHRLFDDPLWLEFDIEIRPFNDVVEDYVKKYPDEEEHFRYIYNHLERMPLPRPRVWNRLHALKEAGYKLYLLSNYSSRMFHIHTDGLPFFDEIDGGIISYEVHQLKPHREIYESLFKKYSLDPSECLFFDDRQDNVDGGRKCGMDGRVIYSEEVLLGYFDRLLSPDGINNRFHDPSFSRDERIDWLLSEMSLEEKISLFSHPEKGVGRLGVEGFLPGGEASHGVEARNEQNGLYGSDITTCFPNPIGMSSSWDPEILYEAGRVTGREARALWKLHRKTGLSRWAPTIDMERDPRWGRNEEGYGEDPFLTSKNAGAYVRGMQGDEKDHILCSSSLKHFYANNDETDRFFSNSSIGMRDKYDYYLPPFINILTKDNATGVMAAYNKVNGIPCMTDPELKSLLKDRCGTQNIFTDGFALVRLKDFHHECGTIGEGLALSLKAGTDIINDKPEVVEKALRDALELSLIAENELDTALRNTLMTGMRLGLYDPHGSCPYDDISYNEIDSEYHRDVCRRLSEESLVLLENKNSLLPLSLENLNNIALAGPLADKWYMDWYCGIAPFNHTLRQGIAELTGSDIYVSDGLDTYKIYSGKKAWHVLDDGSVILSDEEDADLFQLEDWNDGVCTIKCVSTGKYVQSLYYTENEDDKGLLKADKDDVFDWFVTCRFHIISNDEESFTLTDRFGQPVGLRSGGFLSSLKEGNPLPFKMKKISDGAAKILEKTKNRSTLILALGCNPMIPAREDYDRVSIALPACQQKLLDTLIKSGKKVIAVLISNYPYTMKGLEKKAGAVLLSPTGSEYMGDALASAIFGRISPAGRLVQSWPVSETVLPDISDYRIMGQRTYRYVSDDLMYPFGYGLSYGTFEYSDLNISEDATDTDRLKASLVICNTGSLISDEVVAIYASAPFSDSKFTSSGYGRRLVAFKRIKSVRPGESRKVTVNIDKTSLQIFDVVLGSYIIYGGKYHFYAGYDSLREALSCDTMVEGTCFTDRDLSRLTPVYACDDYAGIEFTKGIYGMTAAIGQKDAENPHLTFTQSHMPANRKKAALIVRSKTEGEINISWNGKTIASWQGNTSSYNRELLPYEKPSEYTEPPLNWEARFCEIECDLKDTDSLSSEGELVLDLSGDIEVLSVKMI